MTTRAEHMAWCKERAIAELPDMPNALASLASDFRKHDETADLIGFVVTVGPMHAGSPEQFRRFIEDFA